MINDLNPLPRWRRNEKKIGFLLVAPALLILGFVIIYPLGLNIFMSFQKIVLTKPQLGTPFIGFENYRRVLDNEIFWRAAGHTIQWVLCSVSIQVLLGLSAALLLNAPIKGRSIFRGIILVPWVTPGVVASLNWRWMLDGQMGIINKLLVSAHIIEKPIAWLGQYATAFPAVIIAHAWKNFPFSMLMLLAALQTIPKSLYEAAEVDGANHVHKFVHITLPEIWPTLSLTMLLTSIWTFNNFDTIWLMTEGGPSHASEILTTMVYKTAFQAFNLGEASSLAVLMFIMLLGLVIVYGRLMMKREV